jgi:hypothetical protein
MAGSGGVSRDDWALYAAESRPYGSAKPEPPNPQNGLRAVAAMLRMAPLHSPGKGANKTPPDCVASDLPQVG